MDKVLSEWSPDDTLPTGWKKRSYQKVSNKRQNCQYTVYEYLAPSEEKFSSRPLVVAYMKTAGTYSSEEIDKVLQNQVSKYPSLKYDDWVIDDSLPVGWKIRREG